MLAYFKVLLFTCFMTLAVSTHAIEPSFFPEFDAETLNVNAIAVRPDKNFQITLNPLLVKPQSPPPWRTIVLPSNCSGLDDRMWRFWVPALIKNDIAAVLVDSYNPRGFPSVCENAFKMLIPEKINDLNLVLDFLRNDRRFESKKIAVGGHSQGAISTLFSAYVGSQTSFNRSPAQGFNLFVAAAPECRVTFKDPELIAPLLIVVGELDDYTEPGPCIKEAKRLEAFNQKVQLKVIKGVYHSFTSNAQYNPKLMKSPHDFPSVFIDELSLTHGKSTLKLESGEVTKLETLMRKHAGILGSNLYGAHSGGDWNKADEVTTLMIDFLKSNGW
jgi:dienelactone hydrolase